MTTKATIIAAIDLSHIFRQNAAACKDEEPSVAVDYTITAVQRIVNSPRFDHVIVCLDRPPYFRKNISEDYKANRTPMTDEMRGQQKAVYAKIKALGLPIAQAPGFEADDVIAGVCKFARAQDNWKVVIYSADKDLAQLVTMDVSLTSTRVSGETLQYADVEAKFGVPPNKLGDYLALSGDSSDGIKGCPGCGPKKAVMLLKEYGDLDGVLAATDIKGKLGEAVRDNHDKIQLAKVLVTLVSDIPGIVWSELFDTDVPASGKVAKPMTEETPDAEFEDNDFEPPTAGDKLVGGALTRQAVAPPPRSEPKQHPVAQAPPPASEPKQRAPEPGPGIVKAAPAERALTTVELRPGLSVSNEQLNMYSRLASELYEGGMYEKFPNKAAIFTIILMGIDLGLSPTAALGSIHLIEGRPTPGAHLLIARAEADPNCEYLECIESTTTSATYETRSVKGSGKVRTFQYTIEDAKRAGMLSGGSRYNWEKRPREMLAKTCGSQAVRLWYAGSITGLYSAEEMGHATDDAA